MLRRAICRLDSRRYGRWFTSVIRRLGDDPAANLRAYLLGQGWPDDDAFVPALVEYPIYARERAKCWMILDALEASYGHKERVERDNLSIEHVMPQSLGKGRRGKAWREMLGEEHEDVQRKWLHTPGNLTLTGLNSEMGNKPFPQKQKVFSESHLDLNAELCEYETWDEESIRERGEDLAQRVAELWARPDGGPEFVLPDDAEDGNRLSPLRRRWLAYWTAFAKAVEDAGLGVRAREIEGKRTLFFTTGDRDFQLWGWLPRGEGLAVGATFRRKRGRGAYDDAMADREEIERQVGESLEWDRRPRVCDVYASLEDIAIDDRVDWPDQHAWAVGRLRGLGEALAPYLEERETAEE